MKKITILLGVAAMSLSGCWADDSQIACAQVTFGSGVILVFDCADAGTFDLEENTTEATMRGKKDKQNIATIFAGLAGSCAHVGEIIAAQTDREKKQGILNLLGTIFTVAAQLTGSAHRVRPSVNEKEHDHINAAEGAAAITLRFFDVLALENDPLVFIKDNEILTKLYQLNNDEQRIVMIQSCMEQDAQAIDYWNNLGQTLEDYIAYSIAATFNVFNQIQENVTVQFVTDTNTEQTQVSENVYVQAEDCDEAEHIEAMVS